MANTSPKKKTVRVETKITSYTTTDKHGNTTCRKKKQTVHYVDEKPVKLNWLDKLYMKLLSEPEKYAFLAKKLKKNERKRRRGN